MLGLDINLKRIILGGVDSLALGSFLSLVHDMATVNDIAERAGVTIGTVSNVLNGRHKGMRADARKRAANILAIAEELGYRPNSSARAMATGSAKQIGVMVMNSPDDPLIDTFAYQTILGINDAMEAEGYLVCHVRVNDVRQALDGEARVFREQALNGLIVLSDTDMDVAERIRQIIPQTIWCDTNVWEPTLSLRRDEAEAGRLLAQHLIGVGYRRLIFHDETLKDSGTRHHSFDSRYSGVRAAAEAAGVPCGRIESWWEWDDEVLASYRQHASSKTAFITGDSCRLHLGLRAFSDLGLRPGHDAGLACCEDDPDTARVWGHLPRVSFDRYAMGRESARMMLALIRDQPPPESVRLPVRVLGEHAD